jgi:hypothetical protein
VGERGGGKRERVFCGLWARRVRVLLERGRRHPAPAPFACRGGILGEEVYVSLMYIEFQQYLKYWEP